MYVSTTYDGLYVCLPFFPQLKQEYDIFKDMCAQSGWGWDNEKDVPDISDEVWNAYLNVRFSQNNTTISHLFCRNNQTNH